MGNQQHLLKVSQFIVALNRCLHSLTAAAHLKQGGKQAEVDVRKEAQSVGESNKTSL